MVKVDHWALAAESVLILTKPPSLSVFSWCQLPTCEWQASWSRVHSLSLEGAEEETQGRNPELLQQTWLMQLIRRWRAETSRSMHTYDSLSVWCNMVNPLDIHKAPGADTGATKVDCRWLGKNSSHLHALTRRRRHAGIVRAWLWDTPEAPHFPDASDNSDASNASDDLDDLDDGTRELQSREKNDLKKHQSYSSCLVSDWRNSCRWTKRTELKLVCSTWSILSRHVPWIRPQDL